MKLRYNQRVFESASKDPGRYAFHGVEVKCAEDGETATLSATNGHQLVRLSVDLEPVEKASGPFPPVILDAGDLRKAWGSGRGDRELYRLNGAWCLRNGASVTEIRERDGEFPRYDLITTSRDTDVRVSLDVKNLLRLVKATGADAVRFSISRGADECVECVGVEAFEVGDTYNRQISLMGAIMPFVVHN